MTKTKTIPLLFLSIVIIGGIGFFGYASITDNLIPERSVDLEKKKEPKKELKEVKEPKKEAKESKPVETEVESIEAEIEPIEVKTSLYQYGGSDDLSIYQGDSEILNFYVGIKGGSETVYLSVSGDFGENEIIIQPEIIISDEIIPIPIEIIANELGSYDLVLHAKKLDSSNGQTNL